MSDYVPCDGLFVRCQALENRLGDWHNKGLGLAPMMNFKTGEACVPIILYKKTASDQGLILNFCPWCGKKLNRSYTARSAKKTKEAA